LVAGNAAAWRELMTNTNDSIQNRQYAALSYVDPLQLLRQIEPTIVGILQKPETVAHLTQREKNKFLEKHQAAFLGIMMQHMAGSHATVTLAVGEFQDGDCVIRGETTEGAIVHRVVQLKQLPPHQKNQKIDVQHILDGLRKYSASPDLIVAIWLNRDVKFFIENLNFDKVPVQQLWFFGDAVNSDLTLEGGTVRDLREGVAWFGRLRNLQADIRPMRFKTKQTF
jgi:hypothetical protein